VVCHESAREAAFLTNDRQGSLDPLRALRRRHRIGGYPANRRPWGFAPYPGHRSQRRQKASK
jgi:hypothetical protein